jgi:hypothetical protein
MIGLGAAGLAAPPSTVLAFISVSEAGSALLAGALFLLAASAARRVRVVPKDSF